MQADGPPKSIKGEEALIRPLRRDAENTESPTTVNK
jgi:hypothetical protein